MSTESPSQPKLRSSAGKGRAGVGEGGASWGLRLFDAGLIGLFLALAFLLGVFPLKDTDFYWHLRTGDLIRKFGEVPRVDFYTFTRAGAPWIDLHWVFQVTISWIYERGGVPALTLAKCLATCASLLLLITARRRSWPVWMMILAWLPALLVLSGRMYVRPETMSLFYLSIHLAVICRWDRWPALAWLLPFAQLAWVNSQGLFVLGPIVLSFGLIDAALRSGNFEGDRRRWWTIVMSASLAVGLACLLNPYGIRGALYPLELAGTMGSPVFSQSIAELMPIPAFIASAGLGNLPLQIHFATIALGALSFLIPILAGGVSRIRAFRSGDEADQRGNPRKGAKTAKRAGSSRKTKGRKTEPSTEDVGWRISVFRLLLFGAFTALSFQATRNSHQFAAVVGAITAWNFAEWAGTWRSGREGRKADQPGSDGIGPRAVALVSLLVLMFVVGGGWFYQWTGEGRTIGWGEEPLWFPHEAARFTGEPGMPEHFLSYHNGHASVFIYYNSPEKPGGPGRTVFTDPRLEVQGVELYQRYLDLKKAITTGARGWEAELDAIGRPSILVDHHYNAEIGAALLASRNWRCVWFDPIAAVFVHQSYADIVDEHGVDFGARHFHPIAGEAPHDPAALIAAARGLRNYASFLTLQSPDRARPFAWLALDYAWRIVGTAPDALEGWKTIGNIELLRESSGHGSPRFRMPFDPVFDLSPVRATYALRRAHQLAPTDFLTLAGLEQSYEGRGMLEPLLPILDRILSAPTNNPHQVAQQVRAESLRGDVVRRLGGPPPTSWNNLAELDQIVEQQLAAGRLESAASLWESAYPDGRAPWDVVLKLSTLHLHLGEPDRARQALRKAGNDANLAVRDARLAVCDVMEGRFNQARTLYQKAVEQDPELFEARYGLAIVEQDDGHAAAAYEQALAAVERAPDDVSRASARAIAAGVSRFAGAAEARSRAVNDCDALLPRPGGGHPL